MGTETRPVDWWLPLVRPDSFHIPKQSWCFGIHFWRCSHWNIVQIFHGTEGNACRGCRWYAIYFEISKKPFQNRNQKEKCFSGASLGFVVGMVNVLVMLATGLTVAERRYWLHRMREKSNTCVLPQTMFILFQTSL